MRYALLGLMGAFFLAFAAPAAAPASYPYLRPASATGLSYNWAGYVAQGKTYSGVSGRWIVPDVGPGPGASTAADATWVGLGGVSSDDLIQAGTQALVAGHQVIYEAWIELMPEPSTPIPLDIEAGDEVAVSIQKISPGRWDIAIDNHTSGDSYHTQVAYRSEGTSAEWVEEMPAVMDGSFIPLSDFGTTRFLSAAARVGTSTVGVAQAGGSALSMINGAGDVLAAPSVLGVGSSFTVSRTDAPATPQGSRFRYARHHGTYR